MWLSYVNNLILIITRKMVQYTRLWVTVSENCNNRFRILMFWCFHVCHTANSDSTAFRRSETLRKLDWNIHINHMQVQECHLFVCHCRLLGDRNIPWGPPSWREVCRRGERALTVASKFLMQATWRDTLWPTQARNPMHVNSVVCAFHGPSPTNATLHPCTRKVLL